MVASISLNVVVQILNYIEEHNTTTLTEAIEMIDGLVLKHGDITPVILWEHLNVTYAQQLKRRHIDSLSGLIVLSTEGGGL